MNRGLLIDSEITQQSAAGFDLVIRHKRLPFTSYPNEWCAPMLKDAALTTLDLLIELYDHGLTLKDGHPWNLLFDGSRPVFVDLTSITPLKHSTWPAFDEFSRFCVYPLFMMANGHERIARGLLSEYDGVHKSEALGLTRSWIPSRFAMNRLMRRAARKVKRLVTREVESQLSELINLRKDLQTIYLRRSKELAPASTAAGQVFGGLQSRVRPSSILTLGRNAAPDAAAIAASGCRVVAFEPDSVQAAQLYSQSRDKSLPVLPLVIDFVKPTPSIGYSSHYSIAAHERLSCDLVWAPELVDDLVLKKYLPWELIIEGLSLFTRRWLLVGFPHKASSISDDRPAWYSREHLVESLTRRFRLSRLSNSTARNEHSFYARRNNRNRSNLVE